MIVYAVVDGALSPEFPLGDSPEVFIRREDTEQYCSQHARLGFRIRLFCSAG